MDKNHELISTPISEERKPSVYKVYGKFDHNFTDIFVSKTTEAMKVSVADRKVQERQRNFPVLGVSKGPKFPERPHSQTLVHSM